MRQRYFLAQDMLEYENLTHPERLLWDAIEAGKAVSLREPKHAERDDPANGATSDGEPKVRAQLLLELATVERRPSGGRPRALRLRGARITGELDFNGLTLVCPLAFEGCCFEEPVSFDEARAPRVELVCCHVETFAARQLKTRGDLDLSGLTAKRVILLEARIGGRLDLSGAKLLGSSDEPALSAEGLRVDQSMVCGEMHGRRFAATGEVSLLGASIGGRLDFSGANLANSNGPALSADRLWVDRDVFCRDPFTACGEVSLHGARIRGQLDFSGAKLTNSNGPALSAGGLQVDQSMFCAQHREPRAPGVPRGRTQRRPWTETDGERFTARGEVILLGARIRGQLDLSGAKLLANPERPALSADRLQVDQEVFCCDQFTACGEVSLTGARIRGGLDFSAASLANSDGPALSADRLRVDQNMDCGQRFSARGELRLRGAHISGQLKLFGPLPVAPGQGGVALPSLESVEAAQRSQPQERQPRGVVDFTDARVGQLQDAWPTVERTRWYHRRRRAPSDTSEPPYRPRLAGFVYGSLAPEADHLLPSRLDWIARAEEGYLPQAYDQLAEVFRRAGREDDARDVAIAKHRQERKTLSCPGRWWNRFLDWMVGYGYRTWRAVIGLLAVMAIGWWVFEWASWDHHVKPVRPKGEMPEFVPWLYSIDSVLPVINFGQESAWAATGAAQYWYAFSVLAGWVLATALVAVLTATLFRE